MTTPTTHRYMPPYILSWKLALGTLISAVILNACAQATQSSHEEAREAPAEVQIAASTDMVGPVITTREGDVQGYASNSINVFKGVPYARPPIGDLRWRAAQPPLPHTSTLVTQEFGNSCMQKVILNRPVGSQSEDCLTLNIWAPKDVDEKAPVMVWIHGGAFRFGSGSQAYYDGAEFAKSGIVLVTMNYRLGRFGVFNHPALDAENDTANFALSDQIQALKWIKNNIDNFGGDANNVTVFGESAGAVSIGYLLTMDASRGLFEKAILQSGGGAQIAGRVKTKRGRTKPLQSTGKAWAARQNLDDKVTAAELRQITADNVLEAARSQGGLGAVNPVIDGVLIQDDIAKKFAAGKAAHVPILTGSNSFESSLLASFKIKPRLILFGFKKRQKEARKIYGLEARGLTDTEFAYEAFADSVFTGPARDMAMSAMKHGDPAYVYHFDYRKTTGESVADGAHHGWEIPFVFKNLSSAPALVGDTTNVEDMNHLADTMHAYWVNFAQYGDPNFGKMASWPTIQDGNVEKTMVFNNQGPHIETDFRKPQLDLQYELYQARLKKADKG